MGLEVAFLSAEVDPAEGDGVDGAAAGTDLVRSARVATGFAAGGCGAARGLKEEAEEPLLR